MLNALVHTLLKWFSISFFASFFLLFSSVFAETQKLKMVDIRPTMQEILSYHVEFQEFSSLLVKRSFKVFLEHFDNEKFYLLDKEVASFLDLSDEKIKRITEQYYKDNFSEYEALNKLIEKTILRARNFRKEIARELMLNSDEQVSTIGESYLQYASSENQLKQRTKKLLQRFLAAEKKAKRTLVWTPETKAKILAFLERRLQRFEDFYLSIDNNGLSIGLEKKEHYLALHVLKAMAKSLDAHTAFFSPEEADEMRTSLEKQFEGVGVVLKESIDGVVIIDLIKGGPAEKSGKVNKGDLLVEIDEKSIVEKPYEDVLNLLKDNGKREILLGLKHLEENGTESRISVELRREKIVMGDERLQYSYLPYGDGIIAKLTLPSFYESGDGSSCEKDIREALRNLKTKGNILGLVLDLRENSGGFLNQAVKVAGLFITGGVVVISKYSHGEIQYLRDIDGRVYYNGPMLILTSKGSASAAEIVAQALQDYGAALVVGDERTYGKGSIQYQTVTDKNATAFFKVTVGKYYTVSGKSTQIEGVKADIVVPTEYSVYNIGERFLEYPLKNDRLPSAYVDPLTDVDQKSRQWFKKNYLPNIQKKQSHWIKMLPVLKDNSGFRLERGKNFNAFLKNLQLNDQEKNLSGALDPKTNWGVEDIQMDESVTILKDMAVMQQQNRTISSQK
jgi:carboxyl-terminal processing protease